MSQFIELQRSRLEEIDAIRHETFKRFRKNPELIPNDLRVKDDMLSSKKTRPHKETIIQKHELKLFKEEFNKQINHIKDLKNKKEFVDEAIKKVTDREKDFQSFDRAFDQLRDKKYELANDNLSSLYAMYSSSPMEKVKTTKSGKLRVKKKYILSEEAKSKLDFSIFSNQEQWGKYIDIRRFQSLYQELTKKEITYLQYLQEFDQVSGIQFQNYIEKLIEYLIEFIIKSDPLIDISSFNKDIEKNFEKQGSKAENGEIFCKPCSRPIKEAAYESHIQGKKHKKNVNKVEVNQSEFQEFKLKNLTNYLKETIGSTINNVERINAMTEREKLLELKEMDNDSDYTTANSEPSDDSESGGDESEDEDLFTQLPLGADGAPIPFWLYKLQGLHHSYNCEICGNISYQGRLTFEKHFSANKHQQGLSFLGIDYDSMNLFTNITQIEEAIELWKIIKREKKLKEGEVENAVEVEDKEGNVMSERDYIQLKRQGMV